MPALEFVLLGRHFRADLEETALQLLHELFAHETVAHSLESEWRFELRQHSSPAPLEAAHNAYRAEIHNGFVMVAPSDDALWISSEGNAIKLSTRDRTVNLELFAERFTAPGALMVAVIEALRISGLIPLHTSIAVKDGLATAFVGQSGRGKTTTLITAIAHGYQPLCEDFALLEPQTRMVYPLDRGLRCLPDTLERLQKLFPNAKPSHFDRDKYVVPFETLAPRALQAELKHVYMLERDFEQPTRLEPMRNVERVMALFSASGAPLSSTGKTLSSSAFAQLATQLKFARLWLGNTPVTTVLEPTK
jgi:hypothetical protein